MRGSEFETYPSQKKTPLETCRYVVDMPKSPGAIAAIMTDIVALAFNWLEAAKIEAPSAVVVLLQDFTARLQHHSLPCFKHVGVSLGLNVFTRPKHEGFISPAESNRFSDVSFCYATHVVDILICYYSSA